MNDTNLKIKIDIGTIPILVQNKKVLKLYAFYCTLKAFDRNNSGSLNYVDNLKELCSLMNISQRTFYVRLNACIYHNLIARGVNHNIKLLGYFNAAEVLQLNYEKKYVEIECNELRLEDQIRAEAIKLNLNIQTARVHKKIKESYNTKNHTPEQIRLKLCSLLIAAFVNGSPVPNIPLNLNPDITISQNYTSSLFGCKHQTSGYYWQQTLNKKGLLNVEARKVESECYSNSTKLIGVIGFNPKKRCKFLTLRNLLKPL